MSEEDMGLYREFLWICESYFDEKFGVADKLILRQIVHDKAASFRKDEPRISPRFLPSALILEVTYTMIGLGYTPNQNTRNLVARMRELGNNHP
ncbi:MAG: hypothetical protein MUF61_00205 [archaeon]|jgi:hypothetical protein|nr:hypothetical protein [archaeon]